MNIFIHLASIKITPILPKFPYTLVPFLLIRNQILSNGTKGSTKRSKNQTESCEWEMKTILDYHFHIEIYSFNIQELSQLIIVNWPNPYINCKCQWEKNYISKKIWHCKVQFYGTWGQYKINWSTRLMIMDIGYCKVFYNHSANLNINLYSG